MPGNAVLPAHQGLIITRGLQEVACLLPQDLPFAPVARLLGWQTQTAHVLADTTIRSLVRSHGQRIRQAEQDEVAQLLALPDLTQVQPQLVPATQPRRRAGWPAELSAAVDQVLRDGEAEPPEGVRRADWERVLHARRQEANLSIETLRLLGPEVQPEQTLVNTDEVLTRAVGKRHFWEIRTARVSTPTGTRYLSGTGPALLRQMLVLVLMCAVPWPAVLVVADGARWIRAWCLELRTLVPSSALILDWWHLCKRCRELGSMACPGRKAKATLLRPIYRHLWQGEVAAAVALLEAYRPQAKNAERLEEWITYLNERAPYIPNYRERRRTRQYIGSGAVEKMNDVLVARRQKGQGMCWQESTSDALAALRTLMLNGGWDLYWQHHQILPLAAT
jgi:hypothetical protein